MQKKLSISLLLLIFGLKCISQEPVNFPLSLSNNKRYLVDNNKKPFLIKEFSAWGMMQSISEADEIAFMDSLKEKGFNTIMVSIVSNASSQMGGNPPYWQGIPPFTVQWDFSTPNEIYFQHVDKILKIAGEKGIFVLLVPCYLGYFEDAGQGWWKDVRSDKNTPEKMKVYGEFLGKRYKDFKNILWVAGGDNDAKGVDEPYMKNLITGIKTHDKNHYWTGHFNNSPGHLWSTDNPLYKDMIDIDGFYVWKEATLGKDGPQYVSELKQYKKGKMTFQIDLSYEHDVPHYADNENPQWRRRKMFDGLLSGCAGTSFSSGTLDNQCYWFKNWKPLMSTEGMKEVAQCFRLFDAIPWHLLVSDTSKKIIIKGRGDYGSLEYICAAKTTDDQYYLMYIPKGHTFHINARAISSKPKTSHWFNPRNGQLIKIGGIGTDENFAIAAPDEQDWVLIFESDKSFALSSYKPGINNNQIERRVNPASVHTPKGYSQVSVTDLGNAKMLIISGQVALDNAGNLVGKDDVEKQTEQIFNNIKSIVESENGTMENIVKLGYFVIDISKIQNIRAVRDRFINTNNPPASTLVQVTKLFRDDILLEVEATAIIPKK